MTPGEIHDLKRQNFIENATRYFRFLCTELGYTGPVHSFTQQQNGTIILDRLEYHNKQIDRRVVICNAYHPVDYGFEVQFYRPTISLEHSDRVMAYRVLKEDQDNEQTYLEKAAETIKDKFYNVISGVKWK